MPSETPTSIPSVDQLQERYDAHYARCDEIVKTHNALLDLDATRRVAVREGVGAALAYMNRALDTEVDEAPQANRPAAAVLLAAGMPLLMGAAVVGGAAVAPLAVMSGAYYWWTRGRSSNQKQQQ